jgi:hypothetical protein
MRRPRCGSALPIDREVGIGLFDVDRLSIPRQLRSEPIRSIQQPSIPCLCRRQDKLPNGNDSFVVSGCALLNVAYLIGETKVPALDHALARTTPDGSSGYLSGLLRIVRLPLLDAADQSLARHDWSSSMRPRPLQGPLPAYQEALLPNPPRRACHVGAAQRNARARAKNPPFPDRRAKLVQRSIRLLLYDSKHAIGIVFQNRAAIAPRFRRTHP